ncbi:ankyrin repeat domain-containing protein, partial [Ottowia sp.]|uniref:ankyrin repeat domain-containing protein n=1 Tax=Ottowia sp. TaxID=1898956 RepID=UPI0039E5D768
MKALKAALLACVLAFAGVAAWADPADDLLRAIKQDNASRVASLLRAGADPNARDPRGVPALYVALQEGSLEAARALVASPRLDPDLRTPTDESVLMMAALKGELDIARALIAKGAQVNRPGWSPLHYAATGGDTAMIRLLLERRAEVDARSPNESTPLMLAARYGTVEAVQMLLRAGADPRARNQLGMDALDFAVSGNRPDAIELLTQAKRRAPVRTAQPPAPAAP